MRRGGWVLALGLWAIGLGAGELDRALELAERDFGPRHFRLIPPLTARARERFRRGEYVGAEADLRRALALRQRRWGVDDPEVLALRTELARALIRTGRLTEARRHLGFVLPRRVAAHGVHSDQAAETWTVRALLHMECEQAEPAAVALGRAEAIRRERAGPDTAGLGEVLHLKGRLGLIRGDLAGAEAALAEALALRQARRAAPWEAALTRGFQGRLASMRGDLEGASKLLVQAATDLEASVGALHPLRLRILAWDAENTAVRAALTPYPSDRQVRIEARLAAQRVLALAERALPEQHPDFGRYWRLLARGWLDAGRPQEAVPPLTRALQLERKQRGRDHGRTRATARMLEAARAARRVAWRREVAGPEG